MWPGAKQAALCDPDTLLSASHTTSNSPVQLFCSISGGSSPPHLANRILLIENQSNFKFFSGTRINFNERVFGGVIDAGRGQAATVVDDPMRKGAPLFLRQKLHQIFFNPHRVFKIAQVIALHKANNVRVYRNAREDAVRLGQNYVSCLTTNAGEFNQ